MMRVLVVASVATADPWSGFDQNWRFHRGGDLQPQSGDTDGWISRARGDCDLDFCQKDFEDGAWRSLELPHDWSAEDLPSRSEDTEAPVLEVRNGSWRFFPGAGDGSEMKPEHDDSSWAKVTVPHDWRDPPTSYTDENAYAWYRTTVKVTDVQRQAAKVGKLRLALGTVVSADETYINGVRVGSTGSMGKENCRDNLLYRSYNVPFSVVSSENLVVVAVKAYSPGGDQFPGGLFDSEAADARMGMFDPGASVGQKQTGYAVGGEGWYRKTFVAPRVEDGGSVHIRFDGVYMNSDVWLNGKLVGTHPYGYTTFSYDLSATAALLPAPAENTLSVRVRNNGQTSRWYSGSGIYRHVWLGTFPKVHVPLWGLNVYTPNVSYAEKTATAVLNVTVANGGDVSEPVDVRFTVFGPDGHVKFADAVPQVAPAPGDKVFVAMTADLSKVNLWSTDSPALYRAEISLDGGRSVATSTTFGIRHIEYSATSGFKLNGVSTKFQGGCVHHDNGPLGAVSLGRAEERRVEVLKANGYNAIRTSHNPVSDAFLDACDRLGVMVMDEAFDCWEQGKNSEDYHLFFDEWWRRDMEAMVLRDRNHPSIVMWSIGNEIPMRDSTKGHQLSQQLADYVRAMDPAGRPVTAAVPGVGDQSDAFFDPLDVAGYNYSPNKYEGDHERHPERMIVATESFPAQSFKYWDAVWKNDYVLGDFIWTAIDYIGESAIGANGVVPDLQACGGYCPRGWDYHVAFCGDIDLVGHQKPQSIYRNILWNVSALEIAVHPPAEEGKHEVVAQWGWPDQLQSWTFETAGLGTHQTLPLKVDVYSRYESVQLLLNGLPADPSQPEPVSVSYDSQFTATFGVPFVAGELTAVGFVGSKEVARKTLRTASKPYGLKLTVDHSVIAADRDDLAYVTAQVVDEVGIPVPEAAIDVVFDVVGPAELAAVGSGDPQDTGSFHADTRRTYRGRCVAIVRPGSANAPVVGGTVVVKARAAGMLEATVTISVGEKTSVV